MRTETKLLLFAGGIAVSSLALVPFERIAPDTGLSVPALRLAALLQPALLVTLAVLVGVRCAPAVGLRAPLVEALARRGDGAAVLRRAIGPAIAVGLATAALLLAYGATVGRGWRRPVRSPASTCRSRPSCSTAASARSC